MPTIVFASPKGGAGKSTSAVVLATELAHAGADVTLVDCDPNQSIILWASQAPLPPRIRCVSSKGMTENDVIQALKDADGDGKIVIVDLEGVASRLMTRAIARADLVIIPMRATTLDATVGSRALELIKEEEETLGRAIRHAVVFTMTSAIQSKEHRGIEASLIEQGVDVIQPSLAQRAGFSALFNFGGDLRTMPEGQGGNMDRAIENAQAFAQQIVNRLTGGAG
jgi:chromosome partitioning protein